MSHIIFESQINLYSFFVTSFHNTVWLLSAAAFVSNQVEPYLIYRKSRTEEMLSMKLCREGYEIELEYQNGKILNKTGIKPGTLP